MNPTTIETLKAERNALDSQRLDIQNQLSLIDDLLSIGTPRPIIFNPAGTTNGHTNGNGANGHGKTAAKELIDLTRPNGRTVTIRRAIPVPARVTNGTTKSARFDRVLRNVRKPSTVADIWAVAQKIAPEFDRNTVGIYTANAYKDGKLTRVGERGSYVYSTVRS